MVEQFASHLGIELKPREQDQVIRELVEELSAIYSHVPQAVLVVDTERKVRGVNLAAVAMAGSSAEEMRGRRGGEALRCLHHLDDPRGCGFGPECEWCAIRNTVLATIRTGESIFQVEAELPIQREEVRQELTFLVSTSLVHLRDEAHVLITLEDISERKRMEQALLRKEDELIMLLDHIPTQVFYFVDSETYGAVNQAHADFLGMPKVKIEYNRLENVFSPEIALRCRKNNEEVLTTGRPQNTYTWLPDYRERWKLFALSKIPCPQEGDRARHIICSAHEVLPPTSLQATTESS